MTERELFIVKFIDQFYKKNSTRRRSSKNTAHYIVRTINNVCKLYFARGMKFSEEEIYRAFEASGYLLMESGQSEFTWERFHQGHILMTSHLFINIRPQSNIDLRLVMKRTYPSNYMPQTVQRIDELKMDLNGFWMENEELMT